MKEDQRLEELIRAAEAYTQENMEEALAQRHFPAGDRNGDAVDRLAAALSGMEERFQQYTGDCREQERAAGELRAAQRIQMDLLPKHWPSDPPSNGYDLYASMCPAKEVGGDFYDFFQYDVNHWDDHLVMIVADVSGKGIPAAMYMMLAKHVLAVNAWNMRLGIEHSPAEVLQAANFDINRQMHGSDEMFVTAWIGVLDLKTGKLTAANAGHEYPILLTPGGEFQVVRDRHGFVLGAVEDPVYQSYELQLQPGSKLFLYTDGTPEAVNPQGERFGLDRLVQALNAHREKQPRALLGQMCDILGEFEEDEPQFDDVTMLCMEYLGR